MSINDDVKKSIYAKLVSSQVDLDQKREECMIAARNIYASPRESVKAMMKYSAKAGDAALVSKLEADPSYFGTMKGYPGSGNSLSIQGMKDRGLAKEEAKLLPGLIRDALAADNKVLSLEQALEARGGLDKGKGGLDFD
ncbi:hypothetical protein [Ensifer soli]|uniref:hypothetical protein n=1 Tax=Ciceribacter sp. sgz301302 TaxID=3342379 RepID=UPI0035B94374